MQIKVDIQVVKDRLVLIAEFKLEGLGPYKKLYEIERHAKALSVAWKRIKEQQVKGAEA